MFYKKFLTKGHYLKEPMVNRNTIYIIEYFFAKKKFQWAINWVVLWNFRILIMSISQSTEREDILYFHMNNKRNNLPVLVLGSFRNSNIHRKIDTNQLAWSRFSQIHIQDILLWSLIQSSWP